MIDITAIKQSVYIYKCHDSTIQVKGKLNMITLDNCTKTAGLWFSLSLSLSLGLIVQLTFFSCFRRCSFQH